MSDPKINRQTTEPTTDLGESLDSLRARVGAIPEPLEREIDRAARALKDGNADEAAALYRRVERKFNLIQNVLGMRQFTTPAHTPIPVAKKSWWRRIFVTGIVIGVVTLSGGCGTITKYQTLKELQRVEDAKQKLADNEKTRMEHGRDFAYGALKSLDKICEKDQLPEVKVARLLTDRAMLTLGAPDSQNALALQQMVDDLLSANADLRKRGQAELADRDDMIAKLEARTKALEHSVEKAEDSRDAKFETNANKAAQWDEENSFINSINPFHDLFKFIKKLFVLALVVGLLGVLLKVLAMFFPALKPLSALVDFVLGFFGKLIFRAAPAAQQAAGVVPVAAHEVSEKTLAALVQTVQDLRKSGNPTVETHVAAALAENHSDDGTTEAKVRQVKESLVK